MTKKKARPKSKFVEMGEVISKSNKKLFDDFGETIATPESIMVAVGYAEYVEDESEGKAAELVDADGASTESEDEPIADAGNGLPGHAGVTEPGGMDLLLNPARVRNRPSDLPKTWETLRDIWPNEHQDILKRRAEIWHLWDDQRISATQIAQQMSSLSTIKRDLRELNKEGLLVRGYPTPK